MLNTLVFRLPAFASPALAAAADDHAQFRFLKFFALTIRNGHTHRLYCAAAEFLVRFDALASRRFEACVCIWPLCVTGYQDDHKTTATARFVGEILMLVADLPAYRYRRLCVVAPSGEKTGAASNPNASTAS